MSFRGENVHFLVTRAQAIVQARTDNCSRGSPPSPVGKNQANIAMKDRDDLCPMRASRTRHEAGRGILTAGGRQASPDHSLPETKFVHSARLTPHS